MTAVTDIRRAAQETRPDAIIARNALGDTSILRPVLLGVGNADRISELHERVYAGALPGTMRHDRPDFFAKVAVGGGAIVGFEDAMGRLAAYAVLTLPSRNASHCGELLGLKPVALIAQLDGVAVDPAWRGNRLQRHLARWRMAAAARLGRRHICSTAAPRNIYSWMNLLSLGLVIRGLHVMYGGSQRYVLHCDMQSTASAPAIHEIAVSDLDRHRELLDAGYAAVGWTGGQRPDALLFACLGGLR